MLKFYYWVLLYMSSQACQQQVHEEWPLVELKVCCLVVQGAQRKTHFKERTPP